MATQSFWHIAPVYAMKMNGTQAFPRAKLLFSFSILAVLAGVLPCRAATSAPGAYSDFIPLDMWWSDAKLAHCS